MPPDLSDGHIATATGNWYHNEKVEYICDNDYVMEGGPFKTCNNGEWIGDIRCRRKLQFSVSFSSWIL